MSKDSDPTPRDVVVSDTLKGLIVFGFLPFMFLGGLGPKVHTSVTIPSSCGADCAKLKDALAGTVAELSATVTSQTKFNIVVTGIKADTSSPAYLFIMPVPPVHTIKIVPVK